MTSEKDYNKVDLMDIDELADNIRKDAYLFAAFYFNRNYYEQFLFYDSTQLGVYLVYILQDDAIGIKFCHELFDLIFKGTNHCDNSI